MRIPDKAIKISVVSYLNSKPFIYGIQHSGLLKNIDLELDIPSVCAEKLLTGKADIGLVPVAIIPQNKNFNIISDFCIGTKNEVYSVALFSEVPIDEIENVYLDFHSRTSVMLTRILFKNYWKKSPNFLQADEDFISKISGKNAGVIIGDRTFGLHEKFNFVYDLASNWFDYTGLPFVFACWVSTKTLDEKFLTFFNEALRFGLDHVEDVIEEYENNSVYNTDVKKYLTHYLDYNLDAPKKQALQRFWKEIENINK